MQREEMMEAFAKPIKEKDAATTLADVAGSPSPQSGSSPKPQPLSSVVVSNAPPAVPWLLRKSLSYRRCLLFAPLSLIPSPVLPAAASLRVSQTFVAPVPSAPCRLSSAGSSAEEEVVPNVLSAPIHKPILSSRRPPPGLMLANLKPNIFCKPEQDVQPMPGMKGKLTSFLGLRTETTEPPRSLLGMYTPSQSAQAITRT
ncbi:hypothetical protein BDR04DRAFT_1154100 [Suillus decipiens]|nr:hypothetical protein BDR04DRAFT_1154100 [Suillus decipiens]